MRRVIRRTIFWGAFLAAISLATGVFATPILIAAGVGAVWGFVGIYWITEAKP